MLQMLNEIESMTSDEYWELFNESQKLPDGPIATEEYWMSFNEPRKLPDYRLNWEPLPSKSSVELTSIYSGISFPMDCEGRADASGNSSYSEEGGTLWLQVA